jgi:hypothetical protein
MHGADSEKYVYHFLIDGKNVQLPVLHINFFSVLVEMF